MQSPLEYSFDEQLRLTREHQDAIIAILLNNLPGARHAWVACKENDRRGIDVWVELQSGLMLRVDIKFRKDDYLQITGEDDLALETWSVIEKKIIGWTRDPDKQTEYVLWFWHVTGRWHLVPFLLLCKAFQIHWEEWRAGFRTVQQLTTDGNGWHSECVFVPRRVVARAILQVSCSQPSEPELPLQPMSAADAINAGPEAAADFVMGRL